MMPDRPQSVRVGPKARTISHVIRRTIDKSTAKLGITGTQSFVLGYLAWKRDEPPCQRDIETQFSIKHPTATGILQRLREKGFVEFEPDKSDGRLKRIVITEAGIRAADMTRSRIDAAEEALIRGLSESELEELQRLLDKIVENALRVDAEEEGAEA